MPEAWELYFEEFQRRAARVPEQRFGRSEAFAEAAHDAYQNIADRLSRETEWSDDRTMYVMHALTAALKRWIDCGTCSWEELRRDLQAAWQETLATRPSPRPEPSEEPV